MKLLMVVVVAEAMRALVAIGYSKSVESKSNNDKMEIGTSVKWQNVKF